MKASASFSSQARSCPMVLHDAHFVFKDNYADDAGSVLFGGVVDYCKLTGLESYNSGKHLTC